VASFSPYFSSTWCSFRLRASDCLKGDWQKHDDKSIGRTYRRYQGTGQISGARYTWVTDLVQQRVPISWDFSRRPWCWLIQGMRMRGKQLNALDHGALVIIVEPILTWLEAGNDRMPRFSCVPGRMLTRRAIAATDVPTLRTPTEMKPPTFRRRKTFDTPITSRL
jgi:hypothetical protein